MEGRSFMLMKSSSAMMLSSSAAVAGASSSSSSQQQQQQQHSSNKNVYMDPRIWRHLPQPLLDRVLAFLPPPAFFRSRSVCKRFYSLLFSSSFLDLHLRLSPPLPWFLFFSSSSSGDSSNLYPITTAYLLDTDADAWHPLSFSGLIPRGFSPAASAGGLLCFSSDAAGQKTLILCNPLSRLACHLPATQRPGRLSPSVGLAVGNSSFTAAVAGDDLISPFAVKNLTAECLHADGPTGFYSPWCATAPSRLPRLCNLESGGRMVFVSGRFYCMSYAPFSVLAFDVAANIWSKIQAPMRRFLRCPALVELEGRLAMVAAVEKRKLNVPRSVRVWGLMGCGRAWVEVERMPPEVHRQFCEAERGSRGFSCVGHGGVVSITVSGTPAGDVLLYDARRREWRWAPPCPFIRDHGDVRELRGFAYEPRLATPAIGLLESPPPTMAMSFPPFGG